MDKTLGVKDILEAGMHLGHRTANWDPQMKPYIYGERKGIHIIDPEKTLHLLNKACDVIRESVSEGGAVMFVGTKPQVSEIVRDEALRCGAFYCIQRWLGGTLTNFITIRKSIDRLKSLENQKATDGWVKLKKKEILNLERQMQKMHKNLDGILEMNTMPDVIFITDPRYDRIALNEALILNIPIIAIVDTNVNPSLVTYPIPANDDAVRSVKLITELLADSVLQGKAEKESSGKSKS